MSFDNPLDAILRWAGAAAGAVVTPRKPSTMRRRRPPLTRAWRASSSSAVMRALFPQDSSRRAFLRAVGASTALAAISQFFPLGMATEVFAQAAAPEKKDLKVGFIPITCATPIIMAHPMGFYTKHGLNVEVVKTAGWAVIRDKTLNKEYDAAHMLSPMPLAITLGVGSNADPLHQRRRSRTSTARPSRSASSTRTSAIRSPGRASSSPCRSTTRCTTICCATTWPSTASTPTPTSRSAPCRRRRWWRTCAPTISTASSRPIPSTSARSTTASASSTSCRRTSGTGIRAASSPRRRSSSRTTPNTYAALLKAIIDATAFAAKAENRKQIAEAIAPANYLNQPVTVVEQMLTGTYADGLGSVKTVAERIDFDPFPWQSFAVWIMTQMKRWGQIKGDVDYAGVAKQVFLATDTAKLMKEVGLTPPAATTKTFVVMGKEFDPAKPEEYIKSFAIKRAA